MGGNLNARLKPASEPAEDVRPAPVGWLRYVVPNAVTCTGLLCGLFSIMHTMAGAYETAAWLILLCVLLDKLDGTMARLLKASSRFGVELDSFSDFTTFGIAPAFLVLGLMTKEPRYASFWGTGAGLWFVRASAGFLIVASALRLAKFNVLTEKIGSRVFLGIPTTLVGAVSASFMLTAWKYHWPDQVVAVVPIAIWVVGLWMVSNVPMPKIRVTSSKSYNAFMGFNAVAVWICVLLREWPEYLFVMSASYAVVGTLYAATFMREPAAAGLAEG